MSIIVSSIILPVNVDKEKAIEMAFSKLKISQDKVQKAHISKMSVDARHINNILLVYSVTIDLKDGEKAESELVNFISDTSVCLKKHSDVQFEKGSVPLNSPPVIAGFGPCGIFAALSLARNGYNPIVIERGSSIDKRIVSVNKFLKQGLLDSNTNIQFGEGGAGAFSDGKLTTRINDPLCEYILKEMVKFGAPEDILYKAKPHIGTDNLRAIIEKIRTEIISLGGTVMFDTKLEGLIITNGVLAGVKTSNGDIRTQVLVLAIGHSARDSFEYFAEIGIPMIQKPFSAGVRIEHLRKDIDDAIYGKFAGHKNLPKGEYQMSHRIGDNSVYTFCMCPGGVVVPSSSEENMVVTNGMSEYLRDGVNSNSALVVSVDSRNFGNGILDGMNFQRKLERLAFDAGGKNYKAPAQNVGRFLSDSRGIGSTRILPTFKPGVEDAEFRNIFPAEITRMLKVGLNLFERKLSGFSVPDGILTGVETRTSSPVRILRDETYNSPEVSGLYPAGEGAGYAGGIMSSSVDGLKTAKAIIEKFSSL